MILKLFPKENFDKGSINTMNKLIEIAKNLLTNQNIDIPKSIEFYDDLGLFIIRILPQVKNYGLTEKQAIEFIKASLNSGTYGTFNTEENSIIEMNFNPHFKLFYHSINFLNLLIHESLHLYLYSNLKRNIYDDKFKFEGEKYTGHEKIIQLDEGFAGLLTDKILENFDFDAIKDLPIYSGLNDSPDYEKEVEGLNIQIFNKKFNHLYEKNSKEGYKLIEKKFNQVKGNFQERIKLIIEYIQAEISNLPEHKWYVLNINIFGI